MYKIINDPITKIKSCIYRTSDNACIPFDPANTDYQNFKKQINADEAQLQDAEGVIMTDAKAYVASLP